MGGGFHHHPIQFFLLDHRPEIGIAGKFVRRAVQFLELGDARLETVTYRDQLEVGYVFALADKVPRTTAQTDNADADFLVG